MSSYSDSFRNVTSYTGQGYRFVPSYIRPRDPHSPTNASNDIRPKEQQGKYVVSSLWTNSTNGNIWALAKITNNLANWVLISSGGSGPMLMVGVPFGASPISPDVNGLMNFTSTGGTIVITGSAGGVGAQNINFDITGGAVAIEKIQGDDGVNVVPTAGIIKMFGATVLNATHAKPVFFLEKSATTDTEELDVQVTTTSASGAKNINNAGLASFDSAAFTVDAPTGFIGLVGGGGALVKVNVQTGTTPVVPSAGAITFNGATALAGTNPVRTDGTGPNTMALEVQISQAIAGTDASKIGLAAFNSAQFTVDANGFVSITNFTPFNYVAVTFNGTNPSPYTVTATDEFISCDTTAATPGPITIKLPNAPTTFREFVIKDRTGGASTNNISVTTVGGAVTIDGQTTYTMAGNFDSISLLFNGTSYEVY